jgi:hypothetical protein
MNLSPWVSLLARNGMEYQSPESWYKQQESGTEIFFSFPGGLHRTVNSIDASMSGIDFGIQSLNPFGGGKSVAFAWDNIQKIDYHSPNAVNWFWRIETDKFVISGLPEQYCCYLYMRMVMYISIALLNTQHRLPYISKGVPFGILSNLEEGARQQFDANGFPRVDIIPRLLD